MNRILSRLWTKSRLRIRIIDPGIMDPGLRSGIMDLGLLNCPKEQIGNISGINIDIYGHNKIYITKVYFSSELLPTFF